MCIFFSFSWQMIIFTLKYLWKTFSFFLSFICHVFSYVFEYANTLPTASYVNIVLSYHGSFCTHFSRENFSVCKCVCVCMFIYNIKNWLTIPCWYLFMFYHSTRVHTHACLRKEKKFHRLSLLKIVWVCNLNS